MLFLQHSPIIIDIFNNLYISFFDVICIGGSLLINMTVSLIFHELQAYSNILASPEAGRGNCLPYVSAPPSLFCESGG